MNLCQEHRDAHRGRPVSKSDKSIWKQEKHRPMAKMDHCALMEVLYNALCCIPGGRRGELTEFPTMIRVMEGHEVFGPLQLIRNDWRQEMFMEEEELARTRAMCGGTKYGKSVKHRAACGSGHRG